MSDAALQPNKIHRLPVKIIYHLPLSSQTFVTTLSGPQPVYVHQRAGSSQRDESWGSMNLKAVARGVCFASPEIMPSKDVADSSLYVLDPRETHMRRACPAFSPNLSSSVPTPSPEVWTGKGMLSWAVAEAGEGKTLVTGRLVRIAGDVDEGLDALVARGDDGLEWGLEISLGVKSAARAVDEHETGCTPLDHLFGKTVTVPVPFTSTKPISDFATDRLPLPSRLKPTLTVKSEFPVTPDPGAFPIDIPGEIYKDPSSLTEAQAQRLLASPHFVDLLKKVSSGQGAGGESPLSHGGTAASKKKKRKADNVLKETQKQSPASQPPTSQPSGYVCYNCGRTKSAVWRMKEMDDGEQRRVCNACGLYWNKTKQMRPPDLWEGVDEDVKNRSKDKKDEPSSSVGTFTRSRQSEPTTGFRRTLTMVVENDAKRLTYGRRVKTATSPVRGSTSAASSTVRRESSPGASWQPQPRRAPTKRTPVQSLDLPLSDDGPAPTPQAADWDENLSAFFNIEEYASVRRDSPPPTNASSPDDPTANFLRSVSSGERQRRQLRKQQEQQQQDQSEDDGFSALFRPTSSVAPSSSPAHVPFDFSQLPPSSPPIVPRRTLAASSPGLALPTPKAITPDVDLYGNPIGPSPADLPAKTPGSEPDMSVQDMQALFNMLSEAAGPSSAGIVDGDIDMLSLLDSFSN